MKKKQEVFKSVKGFEGDYAISEKGEIFSLKRNKIMTCHPNGDGYPSVKLCVNGVASTQQVHTLMALTFLGERPTGYVIDHIDENKLNFHIDNLQYITQSENCLKSHAYRRANKAI